MPAQAGDIADLVTTTLAQLGRLKFTDLMTKYRRTVALRRLMKKGKQTFDDGKKVSFNLMVDIGGSARHVQMGAPDVISMPTVMSTGEVDWRHTTWNWAWDFREPLMNSGASKIVDLIKTRRIAEFASAIVLFEQTFFRCPAATDTTTPYGLPYYIVKSATAATFSNNDGFNGTAQSGYTTVANINPTTQDKWRNYAGPYTSVTKDDFVRKARRMLDRIQFENLVDEVDDYNSGDDYSLLSNYELVSVLEEILESQNENLGKDLAPMDDGVMLKRQKVEKIDELSNDTTNPLYAVNWGVLGVMGLRGAWMKETPVPVVAGQHTLSATHTDCSWNLLCRDRRRCGVISNGTTEMS